MTFENLDKQLVETVLAREELMRVAGIDLLRQLPADFRRQGMSELAARVILSTYSKERLL